MLRGPEHRQASPVMIRASPNLAPRPCHRANEWPGERQGRAASGSSVRQAAGRTTETPIAGTRTPVMTARVSGGPHAERPLQLGPMAITAAKKPVVMMMMSSSCQGPPSERRTATARRPGTSASAATPAGWPREVRSGYRR